MGNDDDDQPVTKAQIKRMKEEAKQVLERPMYEKSKDGFGFKMMTAMGWKPGQGLGREKDGISNPIWVEPREGKCGLFSVDSGEARPKKDERPEEERYAETKQFITEGGAATRKGPRAPKGPPPTAKTVAPAVLDLLTRPGGVGELGGVSAVVDLLSEALAGPA